MGIRIIQRLFAQFGELPRVIRDKLLSKEAKKILIHSIKLSFRDGYPPGKLVQINVPLSVQMGGGGLFDTEGHLLGITGVLNRATVA